MLAFQLLENRGFAWMSVLLGLGLGGLLAVVSVDAAMRGEPGPAAGTAVAAAFMGLVAANAWLRFLAGRCRTGSRRSRGRRVRPR